MGTIKSSREIETIFRGAKRVAQASVILLVARTPEDAADPAALPLSRARSSVGPWVRNRSRRVLRAAIARVGGPWPAWDVVLIARPGTAIAHPETIDGELSVALKRAGVA